MPAKPILDGLELQQVQKVEAQENEAVSQHSVPALEGDFLQDLGRRAVRITLNGVLTGPDAGDGLKQLRGKFQKAQPVPFVNDIATATSVDQVLIEALDIRELAGKPERFEYGVAIREFIPPPPPQVAPPPPPPPPPPPNVEKATLVVEVIVDGQRNFDFNTVTVTAVVTQADGTKLSSTLTNRKDNQWTEDNLPPGQVAATATVSAPQAMTGAANGSLQAGQTTKLTIHLTPGVVIAQTFLVHFALDKAFIEPCMRQVLRDVSDFAKNNPTAKLLILGNTDLVGSPAVLTGQDAYNQSLSERRGRSVYAFLTFNRDSAGATEALTEWKELRKAKTVSSPTINDNWGLTQVQHMLQDLDFYPGRVDGQDGPLTREGIRAFRCHVGLPPGNTMDDQTWEALIQAYLGKDAKIVVPASQYFPNCSGEILKWTGAASQDPVENIRAARRRNRRVELLFVHVASLPCTIPQPDTFNLPAPGAVGSNWCVGPGDKEKRTCFVVKHLPEGGQPTGNEWLRQPAQPGTLTVQGTIAFDNGTPYAGKKFALIAPDGLNEKDENGSTGQPVPGKTNDDGTFQFPSLPVGWYSLEVQNTSDVLVRLKEKDASTATGPTVCKFLQSDTERLDVVILSDPVFREIRLPVVAHLITVLNPVTHAVRVCPSGSGPPPRQATAHTDKEISDAFSAANDIWRQARIAFDAKDIIHETCSLSRTECEIDDIELGTMFSLAGDAVPNVVNVFFVGDLAGTAEAGKGISVEDGLATGTIGCAVGDRVQVQTSGIPLNINLDAKQTAQLLAHELGHYLNLPDVPTASSDRLMLGTTSAGDNRTLTADEAKKARGSKGANDDCVPLTLKVTGATAIGGSLSNRFIVIQGSPDPVTVDAQIPDRMLDPSAGTLTMPLSDPGTNDKRRTVSTATNTTVDVVATYTPAGGGQPVSRNVQIRVSNFRMLVDGAVQVGGAGSTTFVAVGDPGQPVIVTADLDPGPFAVPSDLIVWSKGDATDDPQRRTVSRAKPDQVTVSATVAGVTKSVTISIVGVQIADVGILGKGQNTDVPITIAPSPLPGGLSLTLRLETTTGTGEARFAANNSLISTINQTTTVSIHGITESSAVDNIRLTANLNVTPVAQRTLTVVGVTIEDIVGVKKNAVRNVAITILPSPLAAGALTAELKTTSGTGSATFANGATSTAIAQTGTVSVKGVTESSVVNNIRLSVRPSKQTAALAQDDFTVLSNLTFFLRFEVWNENTHVFDPLPAGVKVDLVDRDRFINPDDVLATTPTDAKGRVLFSLADFKESGEEKPDLFFLVHTNKVLASGHTLPDVWSTSGWKATDGTPGLQPNFSGTGMGSEANPVVFRIGVDFHVRLTYLDERTPPGVDVIAAIRTTLAVTARGNLKRLIGLDEHGEAHGVLFDVEGGDAIALRVDFSIADNTIKLQRAAVEVDAWDTPSPDSQSTSIGTQAAPFVLRADGTDHRNRALFMLKNLRELATFLFHVTGGAWPGFGLLTIKLSSVLTKTVGIFRTPLPFSWPVGTVQMPDTGGPGLPAPHLFQWDRGTHIHEISHQIMWKELNFSSADIAFEEFFGKLILTHFENMLSNTSQALVEGWAEFFGAVFAGTGTPPYSVSFLQDSDGNPKGPLGPPPKNQGEKVEGAFANGLWGIFQDQVVTAAIAPDAHVHESVNGDVTVTNPWLLNNDVRDRFLAMIWNPFVSIASASPKDTTAMIAAILAGNPATLAALQAELQAFNMALP